MPPHQEELPIILKHKKSLQKLVSDWNTLKSRWEPEPLGGLHTLVSPHRQPQNPHSEAVAGPAGDSVCPRVHTSSL